MVDEKPYKNLSIQDIQRSRLIPRQTLWKPCTQKELSRAFLVDSKMKARTNFGAWESYSHAVEYLLLKQYPQATSELREEDEETM